MAPGNIPRLTDQGGALKAIPLLDWRVAAFFASALALWLTSSANGRYGMVVLLLAGVCLARVTERLLPTYAARVALAVLLAVQAGISVVASPPRWFISEEWSRR